MSWPEASCVFGSRAIYLRNPPGQGWSRRVVVGAARLVFRAFLPGNAPFPPKQKYATVITRRFLAASSQKEAGKRHRHPCRASDSRAARSTRPESGNTGAETWDHLSANPEVRKGRKPRRRRPPVRVRQGVGLQHPLFL